MFLFVQRKKVQVGKQHRWFSPEDLVQRALIESLWPKQTVYLDWGGGREPIESLDQLHFAARLVQAYACQDMEADFADQALEMDTMDMEADAERRFTDPAMGGGGDNINNNSSNTRNAIENSTRCERAERDLFASGCKRVLF
jgi:hypothetical protein